MIGRPEYTLTLPPPVQQTRTTSVGHANPTALRLNTYIAIAKYTNPV